MAVYFLLFRYDPENSKKFQIYVPRDSELSVPPYRIMALGYKGQPKEVVVEFCEKVLKVSLIAKQVVEVRLDSKFKDDRLFTYFIINEAKYMKKEWWVDLDKALKGEAAQGIKLHNTIVRLTAALKAHIQS